MTASAKPAHLPAALRAALADVVGAPHLIEDRDLLTSHETDVTGRFAGRAAAVARPADTAEVAEILRLCTSAGVAVVPQGGNTGLVGGAIPLGGELVLNLARLDELGEPDLDAGELEAGAGATLAALQQRVAGTPLAFGVDFAARDGATVGGMIATDAGGPHVLRHGRMGDQVAGIEAVLADGATIDRLRTGDAGGGYALGSLLAGSEGTLAVVTRARLRLVPRAASRVTALLALRDTAAAVELVGRLRRELAGLDAADLLYPDGLELVCRHRGVAAPLDADAGSYLLVDVVDEGVPAGRAGPAASPGHAGLTTAPAAVRLAAVLGDEPLAVAVAEDGPRRRALWDLREGHNEAIAALGVPHKLDVALPTAAIAGFVTELRATVAGMGEGARAFVFGHLAAGNLHVNVVGPDPQDERVDEAVLRLVAAHGGSVAAEHGVGQAKARWLRLSRSDADIAAMRRLKRSLDPAGILNPGKLLPPP